MPMSAAWHKAGRSSFGSMVRQKNIRERDQDLGEDQDHDDRFEPRGAVHIEYVGQSLAGFDDDAELSGDGAAALAQFILVLQPRIEALEARMIPQDIRLLFNRHAAGDSMLREERLTD